jgi:hypothetical protein
MQKITVDVFKFEELSEKVQEKLIEKYRENNEMPFLSDCMEDEVLRILVDNGWKSINNNLNLYYSLGYCQGDGAQMVGKFEIGDNYLYVGSLGISSHSYATTLELFNNNGDEVDMPESLKETYHQMCKQLEKFGYDYIESENDPENIKAILIDNNELYLADGRIICE